MKHTRINIWNKGEYSYEAAYGFEPNIRTYIHDDDEVRDCMLVVPGGGYCMVVPSEAEVVAKTFYEKGMNAFVLSYTTDITFSIPLLNQPLKDISRAVRLIRSKSTEFNIDPDRLVICGFSAGGHLCGSLCVHYDDVTEEDVALSKELADELVAYVKAGGGAIVEGETVGGAGAGGQTLAKLGLKDGVVTNLGKGKIVWTKEVLTERLQKRDLSAGEKVKALVAAADASRLKDGLKFLAL